MSNHLRSYTTGAHGQIEVSTIDKVDIRDRLGMPSASRKTLGLVASHQGGEGGFLAVGLSLVPSFTSILGPRHRATLMGLGLEETVSGPTRDEITAALVLRALRSCDPNLFITYASGLVLPENDFFPAQSGQNGKGPRVEILRVKAAKILGVKL